MVHVKFRSFTVKHLDCPIIRKSKSSRTFSKTLFPLSRIATFRFEFFSTLLIAVKNPAAPPPIIMMSYFEFNGFVFANIG